MDNQSFGFTGTDTNIPLNTLNGNENISGTFQGDGSLVEINFEQQNFPMHNENPFGDLNSTQISKQDFGHNFNVPDQQIQNTASTCSNEMQISLESSGVVCSMSSDLSINETNLRVFQDASDQQFEIRSNQNNFPYQPQFSEQLKENSVSFPYAGVMQQPQEQQFVSDISSVEEFSNEFPSSFEQQFQDYQPCQPQQNDFVNESPSLNSDLDSSLLEVNASEYTTKTLDPVEACETRSNQFITCNEEPTEKNLLEAETPDVTSRLITETLPAEDEQYLENGNIACAPGSPGDNVDSNDLCVGKESVAPSIIGKDVTPHESCSLVNDVYDATQGDISKGSLPCDEDPVSKTSNFQDVTPHESCSLANDVYDATQGDISNGSLPCNDDPVSKTSNFQDVAPHESCSLVNDVYDATQEDISKGSLPCDEDPVSKTSNFQDAPELNSHLSPDYSCEEGTTSSISEDRLSRQTSTSEFSLRPEEETRENKDKPKELVSEGSLNECSTKSEESVEPIQKEVVASNQEVFAEKSRQTTVVETEDIESGKEISASETISCQKESANTENNLSQEHSACLSGNGMETKDDAVNDSLGMMPLSPMITMLDDNLGEDGDTTVKSENNNGSPKENADTVEEPNDGEPAAPSIRLTRTRTGALRNKTQRLVEEMDISDDSSKDSDDNASGDGWEYEEGAESAPSPKDPFITVPDHVLKVTSQELAYYHKFFSRGIETVLKMRLHCTTCGRHIGAAPNYIHLGNRHKVLRVLICNRCRSFYGVGKFPRDSDGSELYCRWCGQGGQVICCSQCPNVFCENCIKRNVGPAQLKLIANLNEWACFACNYEELWQLRAVCWALLAYTMRLKKQALSTSDSKKILALEEDKSKCCPSITNKKRRYLNKSLPVHHNVGAPVNISLSAEDMIAKESFGFGHFLFPNDSFESNTEQQGSMEDQIAEEEDYIDPSQFVQPVLEEMSQPSPSSRFTPALPPRRPLAPAPGPIRHSLTPPRPQARIVNTVQQSPMRSLGPRIVIRQGNLMRPGLVPINNQPNSITITATRPSTGLPRTLAPSKGPVRNPAGYLNNIDGVRSMDQLQSLEHVPWFRDGIDSVRAVGFALTKRIRELEARFHSLKNKSDVEKVMILGKKLERLSRRTEHRFKQINSNLKQGSRDWFIKKSGNSRYLQEHPFTLHKEVASDWDDDRELSKPLEKVLIPVNSATLKSTGQNIGNVINLESSVANCSNPPPLVRTNFIPPNSAQRRLAPSGGMQTLGRVFGGTSSGTATSSGSLSAPSTSVARPPVRTVFSSANQVSLTRIRLPGPKSSANRYVQVHRPTTSLAPLKRPGCITERVGAFLNERNGVNKISISVASSSKRKRSDSVNSDSDSDVEIYPTIPELIKLHKIRPCSVHLEKCDDFIVEFLEKQKQAHSQSISMCDSVSDSDSEDCDEPPEVETIVVACDMSEDNVESNHSVQHDQGKNSNDGHMNYDDDDDEIEIIHEVTQSSSVQDSSDSNFVDTVDDVS